MINVYAPNFRKLTLFERRKNRCENPAWIIQNFDIWYSRNRNALKKQLASKTKKKNRQRNKLTSNLKEDMSTFAFGGNTIKSVADGGFLYMPLVAPSVLSCALVHHSCSLPLSASCPPPSGTSPDGHRAFCMSSFRKFSWKMSNVC